MALWKLTRFHGMQRLEDYLNGVVFGTADISGGVAINGLTLIIDPGTGPVTVTFNHVPPDTVPWTPAEIVTFVNTAVGVDIASLSNLSADSVQTNSTIINRRYLRIFTDAAFIVDKDGTANTLLGFDTGADTTRAEVAVADIVSILRSSIEQDTYILVTNA